MKSLWARQSLPVACSIFVAIRAVSFPCLALPKNALNRMQQRLKLHTNCILTITTLCMRLQHSLPKHAARWYVGDIRTRTAVFSLECYYIWGVRMGSKLLLGLPQQTAELFPLPLATEVGSQLRARHTENQTGASTSICPNSLHLFNGR